MEISAPGRTNTAAAVMEADTGLWQQSSMTRDSFFFGRVVYVHGHGIDQPLAITRYDYADSITVPVTLLPHTNSRGGIDTASYVSPCFTFSTTVTKLPEEDGGGTVNQPPPTVHCLEAPYPARYHLSSRESVADDKYGPNSWMGSLITDSRDASGQMYGRNRYYDPRTGRFTQEDPIGLAGGVNVYGFAAGDPVSYGDPFGLSACPYTGIERSTSLDDCPAGDDALFFTFAILRKYGGPEGAETIETFAENFLTISFEPVEDVHRNCMADTNGCESLEGSTIHMIDAGPVDNAVRLTHEAGTHVRMSPHDHGSTRNYAREEPIAQNRALRVYSRLPSTMRNSTFYGPIYSAWVRGPAAWTQGLCEWGHYKC